MASSDSNSNFAVGFLVGGIVGVVIGTLIAPRAGIETRQTLLEQSEHLRGRAEEMAARVRERTGPTVESMRERVAPVVEQVRSRVRRGEGGSDSDRGPSGEGEPRTAEDS